MDPLIWKEIIFESNETGSLVTKGLKKQKKTILFFREGQQL